MTYRMTVRSNPRLLLVFLAPPVIVAGGILLLFLLGILYGLIALAAAVFFAYTLLRLTRRQLATRIQPLADEILFTLHGSEKIRIPWDKIRIAGMAIDRTRRRRERRLFVYEEEGDQLFTLTDEFENLDGLAAEVREKTDFRDFELSPGETLKGKIRELIGQA